MKFNFKAAKASAQKGFTLIELAVVIAIIAILAAVAVPRFSNLTAAASRATADNYVSVLNTGSSSFMAAQGRAPSGYTEFVTTAVAPTGLFQVSTLKDRNSVNLCTAPTAATITCTFPGASPTTPGAAATAVYTFNGGSTTMSWS